MLAGLGLADRKTLSDLLAFLQGESVWKQIGDLFAKWGERAEAFITKEDRESIDRLALRLSESSAAIDESPLSDDALRLSIWMLLRQAYRLPAELTLSRRGAREISRDLGARMAEVFFHNADPDWRTGLPPRLRSLFDKPVERGTFGQMIEDYALAQVTALLDENSSSLSDQERERLFEEWIKILSDPEASLDAASKSGAEIEALLKVLMTGGSITGLAVAVELAGFSAYILAAQASAIIPFVGGKTMVSLLAVVTNPIFVIPVVWFGFRWANDSANRNLMTSFGCIAGSTLAIIGMRDAESGLNTMVTTFSVAESALDELQGSSVRIDELIDSYRARTELMVGSNSSPSPLSAMDGFDRPLLSAENSGSNLKSFLGGLVDEKSEMPLLASLTIGDFVYHSAMIDPQAVAAADFSSVTDVDELFDFAQFAGRFSQYSAPALAGATDRLKGYIAEQMVAARLVDKGHIVELPGSAAEPGYDLIVDGQKVQVKCRDDLSGLNEHFERYPDIPVIANSELQEQIDEQAWADQVYFLEGFSDEHVTQVTEESLEGGAELLDYDVPIFAASLAAARNLMGWWKGSIPADELVWHIATDAAGRGALSLVGGFTGATLGLLMFGPAGAVIMGPVGGIAGAGTWSRVKAWSGEHLNQEAVHSFKEAGKELVSQCVLVLNEKGTAIQARQARLGNGVAGRFAILRLDDDLQFIEERTRDLEELFSSDEIRVNQYQSLLLEATLRSGIFPSRIQSQLNQLAEAFSELERTPGKKAKETAEQTGRVAMELWGSLIQLGKDAAEGAREGIAEVKKDLEADKHVDRSGKED